MDIDASSGPSHGGPGPSDLNFAGTGPLNGRVENQLITSLKFEIEILQQQLLNAGNAVPEEHKSLEPGVAEPDTTTVALRSENESLQGNIRDRGDRFRTQPRVERDLGLGEVQVLEVSNGELIHGQADRRTRLGEGGILRG